MLAAKHGDPIPELSMVALTRPCACGGSLLPAGAEGAVVFAHRDGVGYEVEFTVPFRCVVTLGRDDIRPI